MTAKSCPLKLNLVKSKSIMTYYVEVTDNEKQYSLISHRINYSGKKFCDTGPSSLYHNFLPVINSLL